MSSKQDAREKQNSGPGKGKKAYEKPSFRHERVFETMALACGKVNPTTLQCTTNRKNS